MKEWGFDSAPGRVASLDFWLPRKVVRCNSRLSRALLRFTISFSLTKFADFISRLFGGPR